MNQPPAFHFETISLHFCRGVGRQLSTNIADPGGGFGLDNTKSRDEVGCGGS